MKRTLLVVALGVAICHSSFAQRTFSGNIVDSETNEPLVGASIIASGTSLGTVTDINGGFELSVPAKIDTVAVSYIGYTEKKVAVSTSPMFLGLNPTFGNLQQVVVTANREASLRTESPIAISKISPVIINDTKPVLITELINKVPGVVMLNYNNEQHAMSIRQPMGTAPYFLYMEDGIPVRPMGIFNHNALIEMNVFSISRIEVIKGPASSLYGPEAVGGAINFITHRPTAIPTVRIGIQGDQWGYKRLQYGGGGMVTKKLGVYVSGFAALQKNSWQTSSDYEKSSVNARLDYAFSDKTTLTLAFSGNEYRSDMAGSVDSIAFYSREYTSTTDFTYRKVHSQRTRATLSHQWNEKNETSLTLGYRDNYIEQNPNYGIRWTTGSSTATGEKNRNSFFSRIAFLQHSISFDFLNARLLGGASMDYSPTNYWAHEVDLGAQLRPGGKSVEKYTLVQERPDLFLSNYRADLVNSAVFSQFEINPVERLKITVGLRYDRMEFDYENFLDWTFGNKAYEQLTPKIGATYDLMHDKGVYVNYSQGFSPPSLTAIFRKKTTAHPDAADQFYYNLEPAHFDNVEIGGWAAFADNKIYVDVAAYQMTGHKELLHILQADNSYDYQSAGKTLHRGIEYGITYKPDDEWAVRFGGTNANHHFEEFVISTRSSDEIRNVNGKDMPQSPGWIANSEVTYKPDLVKGLRLSVEWQRIGSWYQNQINSVRYDDRGFLGFKGISYLNFRTGYTWGGMEAFVNIMNLTDELYANSAIRGNSPADRTTYTPAAPRTFVVGLQYSFTGKKIQ